jgi:Ca-activated chloride channel homolog
MKIRLSRHSSAESEARALEKEPVMKVQPCLLIALCLLMLPSVPAALGRESSSQTTNQTQGERSVSELATPRGNAENGDAGALAGGMAVNAGIAIDQDREACLDCSVDLNGWAGGRDRELPGNIDASLSPGPDSWTLRSRVNEVTVFFTATEGHKFVQGLNKENIRVSDDNKQVARISAFGYQRDLPFRLGLVVDTSASVNPQFRLQQEAAIQFLRQVVRQGQDRAFVLGFANHAVVTKDYSDDAEQLAAGVAALRNGGGTALFDAIYFACEKLTATKDREPAARILIVLSDGDNNAGRTTLSQAIDNAQVSGVTIYTMDTSPHGVDARRFTRTGQEALERLATETGGRAFSNMEKWEIARAFAAIENEMRNGYALSYQPSDLQEDGRFHHIRIEAEKSGRRFHVHARKGYYARLVSSTQRSTE